MSDKEYEFGAYYLKRGKTIRGPLERAAILQAAKARKLLSGDQIATRKDGPWLNITKKPLQRMQQGRDIEIKSPEEWLTIPPNDRDELKEWLQANKNESVVVCPFCGVSVKRRNLLKHCDKLHYSRLPTTNSSLPASQAATKKSAGKSKNSKVSVTRYPKNVEELERLLPPEPPIAYETSRGFFSKTLKVKYKCPVCSIKLTNSLAEAGDNDSCPECNTAFVVPGIKEKYQHQKQLEENRNIAEREEPINPEVTSNNHGDEASSWGCAVALFLAVAAPCIYFVWRVWDELVYTNPWFSVADWGVFFFIATFFWFIMGFVWAMMLEGMNEEGGEGGVVFCALASGFCLFAFVICLLIKNIFGIKAIFFSL